MKCRRPCPRFQRWAVVLLAMAVIAWEAPAFLRTLYPPSTVTFDFYQDWAAARHVLDDYPVYADIGLTIERYLGWRLPDRWEPWYWRVNTHPPPAVLLTLPLAPLRYADAFLLWSVISLLLFAAAIWIVVHQFQIRIAAWWLPTAIAALLLWYPFREQVLQGQINLVLLFLLVVTWAAHRSSWPWTAGAALGVATAVKLFPGLLVVYFLVRREWTIVLSCAAVVAATTVAAVVVLGTDAYAAYLGDVLPASAQWLSHWYNLSVMAFWTKLFDPGPAGGAIVPLWRNPLLARLGGLVCCAALLAVLILTTLQARTRAALDHAFGLTVTGMLLVSPITWSHGLVLLILPFAFMWRHPARSQALGWTAVLLLLVFFVPPHRVWQVLIPGGWPYGAVRPWQTLTALSFQCYAMLGLFALQAVWTAGLRESVMTGARGRQPAGALGGGPRA